MRVRSKKSWEKPNSVYLSDQRCWCVHFFLCFIACFRRFLWEWLVWTWWILLRIQRKKSELGFCKCSMSIVRRLSCRYTITRREWVCSEVDHRWHSSDFDRVSRCDQRESVYLGSNRNAGKLHKLEQRRTEWPIRRRLYDNMACVDRSVEWRSMRNCLPVNMQER